MAPPTSPARAEIASEKERIPSAIMKLSSTVEVPYTGMHYSGFLGENFKELPLMQRLNWLHVPLLVSTPLLALYGAATGTFFWQTYLWAFVYYFFTGMGITAGYHRLFAHRAYSAKPALRLFLLLIGAGAVEGSVRWWSRDHRAHHRYVDTDRDPYASTRGFWYAHIGWMLVKQDPKKIGRADISDLNADPLIRWQHKWYLPLAIAMALVVPSLFAGLLWGDYWGGFFIAGFGRLTITHHSTFFVNSLAHFAGSATYTDQHTARNSWITALLTLGEGYHNFHHEFPSDYRNGLEWYQYDPTKWLIRFFSWIGMAYELQRFPMNEIEKGKLQMQQKALDKEMRKLNWGAEPETLPVYSKAQFEAGVKSGKAWVILDGFVLDIETFMPKHPGGANYIRSEIGTDVSEKFRGEVYKHSNAARNLQATYRIARIQGYWS